MRLNFIFLLLLTCCTSFPTLHPRLLSLKNGICTEYPVISQTNACSITFGPGVEHPLSYCEGNYAIPPSDVTALLEYQKQQCAAQPDN